MVVINIPTQDKKNARNQEDAGHEILDILEITREEDQRGAVDALFHEKKATLLKALMDREKKIIDLKDELGENPGTIKRLLDDLLATGLVVQSRTAVNNYGITEKFYRAKARRFTIRIEWP